MGEQPISASQSDSPSIAGLSTWMRTMLAQDRTDDVVTGVVTLVDEIIERHVEQMRDAFLKRARDLYGRHSEKLSDAQDLRALPAVAQIRALYRVEREAKDRGLDAEARRVLREEKARPLLAELHDWLDAMAPRATPKSPLGQAIAYARKRWPALTRYVDDGRLEIDNGQVERLIRLVALGRKNFLFAGSDAGAHRAAVAYTVMASCTLHEIDPWAYVKDVLEKIVGGWPQRELDRLLPDRWLEEHPAALRHVRPA